MRKAAETAERSATGATVGGGLVACASCGELLRPEEVFRVYGLACCGDCYDEEQGAMAEALGDTGFFESAADCEDLAAAAL